MSLLAQWLRGGKIKQVKNILKWAKRSESLGQINQMQLLTTSFWQVCMQNACMLHAHLSRLSFSELDWYDECSWCTNHQSVFQSPLDRSACICSSWIPECVPPVKIVCSGCNPKVQVICGLPDPYPVLLLFCKGGSILVLYFHSKQLIPFVFNIDTPKYF